MQVAVLGLGRMGANMAIRLHRAGHQVTVWNRSKKPLHDTAALGPTAAEEKTDLVKLMQTKPRVLIFMLPAGDVTEAAIDEVAPMLDKGDIIIDGANSRWTDDKRRAAKVEAMGVHYLDAGVSGGIWGLTEGYATMVGGPEEQVKYCEPIFKDLAPENGFLHCGPVGAGHFTKMVHNGIEYGMMQAYGEGFEILKRSEYKDMDLGAIAEMWRHGSVVRSWLLDLMVLAFQQHGDLSDVRGYVEDSGEGRWTVEAAMLEDVPAPIITLSLLERFHSRQTESYSAKVAAALREQFGGHPIKTDQGMTAAKRELPAK